MKANRFLFVCSAVALPQLAMASLNDTDPRGLGTVNAILQFCTQVDPSDAATFRQIWNSIVGGETAQLNVAEGRSGYQPAFDQTTGDLKAAGPDAAKACAVGAVQWNASGQGGGHTGKMHPTHGGGHDRPEPTLTTKGAKGVFQGRLETTQSPKPEGQGKPATILSTKAEDQEKPATTPSTKAEATPSKDRGDAVSGKEGTQYRY
jgi:hypothetical protein